MWTTMPGRVVDDHSNYFKMLLLMPGTSSRACVLERIVCALVLVVSLAIGTMAVMCCISSRSRSCRSTDSSTKPRSLRLVLSAFVGSRASSPLPYPPYAESMDVEETVGDPTRALPPAGGIIDGIAKSREMPEAGNPAAGGLILNGGVANLQMA